MEEEQVSACPEAFSKFNEVISLNQTQVDRITSAAQGLNDFLVAQMPHLRHEQPFLQGSFPNGTSVCPVSGGEYDVDLVVRTAEANESPDVALDNLEQTLSNHGRYAERIVPKKPCIRLNYADEGDIKFHVDVVPVRYGQEDGPFDAPRRAEDWHATAPKEFTDWCRSQGEYFARTVKAMKRWRDEQQDVRSAVKSIILQVLIAQCMPTGVVDDAGRLTQTLINLRTYLTAQPGVPVVYNPVLPSENLAQRWSLDHFNQFRQQIAEAAEAAIRALNEQDTAQSQLLWADLLGEGFPTPSGESLSIELAESSHQKTVGEKGWVEQLDGRYTAAIVARVLSERRNKTLNPDLKSNDGVILAGWWLRFEAKVSAPNKDYSVWWQVVNTGAHAREQQGLRGEFFRAKSPDGRDSNDPNVNWEATSYTGKHWVEAFVVVGNVVVARSGRFYVNIRSPKMRSFRR